MITAVDSSVLLDILTADSRFGDKSLAAVREAQHLGGLVACPIVWAEVRALMTDVAVLRERLPTAGVHFDPFDEESAGLAGTMWRSYRRQGGSRDRLVPDFLIGAHAQVRGGARLLSRDRGFYRKYFRALKVIDPSAR
jgi:predicted nucleic acid-binding protein